MLGEYAPDDIPVDLHIQYERQLLSDSFKSGRADQCGQYAGDDTIHWLQGRRPLPRSIDNQKLVFDEQRLHHEYVRMAA